MDYLYSTVVDPSKYETEGLCDGIDVRKSNYTELEDRGAIRAHQDWTKYIRDCRGYRGTLGPEYSFMSVAVPECIPDRLEIISYANEFAFLHDDVTEFVDHELGGIENDDMMEGFLEGAQSGFINPETVETRRIGKKQIQSKLLLEMVAIDRECALVTMKAWARFLEVGSSRQHDTRFTSLETYLPYRIMDVGEMFWYGVVTFGMGLHIPDHEMDTCRDLMAPAWIAVGLQNDLYSWPKEQQAAQSRGEDHVVNAIWVLMQEHNVDVDGADKICRDLIKRYVAQYVRIVKENKDNELLSKDLRKYIEAMQYSISGNVVWSRTCPRYNPHASFNKTQLDWMHNGIPALDSSSSTQRSLKQDSSSTSPEPSNLTSPLLDMDPWMLTEMDNRHLQHSEAFPSDVVETPYHYICSLPSKGVRDRFIDAMNHWFEVPRGTLDEVKKVINTLHNSSLILDDFQDGSPLRRGKPAAHTIFGPAQAVNSSSYFIIKAISHIQSFSRPVDLKFAIEKILEMFQGQAMDLHWTYNIACPSISEYKNMIRKKTGALFGLASYLIGIHSPVAMKSDSLTATDRMTALLGLYFQIRDDYQNLMSADYTDQKGFCEDLDEGKYSLPLIHALETHPNNLSLRNILSTRHVHGQLTRKQKEFVLEEIKACNSLGWTKSVLADLHSQVVTEIDKLEKVFDKENFEIKTLMELLRI
ncbi:hypothetical protein ZTR_07521 [Talaromyces verruculosus]|nr:hypothetical protein ZTR_07521 [Talaromyces verruculosus]